MDIIEQRRFIAARLLSELEERIAGYKFLDADHQFVTARDDLQIMVDGIDPTDLHALFSVENARDILEDAA